MTPDERSAKERAFLLHGVKPEVLAIFSELVENPKGEQFLVYSVIHENMPGRTPAEVVLGCEERGARELYRKAGP